jgi:MFS family permease
LERLLKRSYVFCQIPVGFVLGKFPVANVLSVAVICWGAVSLGCGFAHNYAQMSGLRFLVGVAEAPFFPGAVFVLSS